MQNQHRKYRANLSRQLQLHHISFLHIYYLNEQFVPLLQADHYDFQISLPRLDIHLRKLVIHPWQYALNTSGISLRAASVFPIRILVHQMGRLSYNNDTLHTNQDNKQLPHFHPFAVLLKNKQMHKPAHYNAYIVA